MPADKDPDSGVGDGSGTRGRVKSESGPVQWVVNILRSDVFTKSSAAIHDHLFDRSFPIDHAEYLNDAIMHSPGGICARRDRSARS